MSTPCQCRRRRVTKMGIGSMIMKPKILRAWDVMGQDDYDVDVIMAGFSEDIVWGHCLG
jgi:hypothetical protein